MLLINKRAAGRIRCAITRQTESGWVFQVTRDYEDGLVTDEWIPLPNWTHGLVFIPNIGGDIDEFYLKDLIQSRYGRKVAERLDRPNVTTLYHEFNERRARDLDNKTIFAMSNTGGAQS